MTSHSQTNSPVNLSSKPTQPPPPTIFPYQRPVFERLLEIAKASFAIERRNHAIRPRASTLIVGPSGTGKSHLARSLARELNAPIFNIAVGEWLILGSSERGGAVTWPSVVQFLLSQEPGKKALIFLDEIDKIYCNTSWDVHLRTEVYRLLDGQVPPGIIIPDDVGNANDTQEYLRLKAVDILQNDVLIVAAGAFQHLWERQSRPTVGFGGETAAAPISADLTDLVETLPRELVNRFRSELLVLPQLTETDYRRMLNVAAPTVAPHLRATFLRLGLERISKAFQFRQGGRFVEELLLDAVIEERRMLHGRAIHRGIER